MAMIFEFWMYPEDGDTFDDDRATSGGLRALLDGFDGFAGVKRYESCSEPGRFVAVDDPGSARIVSESWMAARTVPRSES